MKNVIIITGLFLFLSTACNSEKENSDTLSVFWDEISAYRCYVFTPPERTSFSATGDFQVNGDTVGVSYDWQGKNIGVYAFALPLKSVQLGMYPESDVQGNLYIKRNGAIQALAEHDLLTAAPQKLEVGKAKTMLRFNYGMSLGTVLLELSDGLDGYTFNIRAQNLIRDGYIDLTQGKVVPGKTIGDLYFSQQGSSSAYDLAFVPQLAGEQMKISIVGMRNIGVDRTLGYELLIKNQDFQSARQYIWTFSVTTGRIEYKGFQEKDRHL